MIDKKSYVEPFYSTEEEIKANRLRAKTWFKKQKELGNLVTIAFNIHPDEREIFNAWCLANEYGKREGFLKLVTANFTREEIEAKEKAQEAILEQKKHTKGDTLSFSDKKLFHTWCENNNYGKREGFLKLMHANFTREEVENKLIETEGPIFPLDRD